MPDTREAARRGRAVVRAVLIRSRRPCCALPACKFCHGVGQSTDWFAVTVSVGAELVSVCDMFADGKVDTADFRAFVKPIARLGLIAREHVAATAPCEFDRAQEQRKAEKLVQRCLDDPDTTE